MPLKLLVLWSSTMAERERMPLPAHQIGDAGLARSTTSVRLAKTADERRTRRDRPSPESYGGQNAASAASCGYRGSLRGFAEYGQNTFLRGFWPG